MKSQNKFLVYALLMFTISGYSIAADKAKSIMNQFKDTLLCHQSPESLIFLLRRLLKKGLRLLKLVSTIQNIYISLCQTIKNVEFDNSNC